MHNRINISFNRFVSGNKPIFAALLVLVTLASVISADDDKWVWGRSNDGQSKADSRIGSSSDEVIRVAKPLLREPVNQKPSLLFQAASNPRLDSKLYRSLNQ